MRRRIIALQPGPTQWRFAVTDSDQQEPQLQQVGTFERTPEKPLAVQLAEVVGPLQITDRLACALPGQSAMFRWLEFPFSDPRKIAAAARPEMARLLPQPLAERVIVQQQLSGNQVLTAAVNRQRLEQLLAGYDDNREPLGFIGLAPLCYGTALDWSEDALLLSVEPEETCLIRYESGQPAALKIMPQTPATASTAIVQQALLLARSKSSPCLRLRLLGISADTELASDLKSAGFELEPVVINCASGPVATELNSTACLAVTAANADTNQLNLRSGEYRLKNDWQALKRRMWLSASLVLFSLAAWVGSGYLQYHQRAAELADLDQQMIQLYQQQFPGEKLLVPAPLQLQSKLKELRQKTSQFAAAGPSALDLLLAVSQRIEPGLAVDINEYLQNADGLRLSGSTRNYDAVSKLLASLQREERFAEVRILDSKQALDGTQVDFQLQILLQREDEQ